GARVPQEVSPGLKARVGQLAYPLAAVLAFLRHRPFSATLSFPDGDHPPAHFRRLLQVAVGNGRFYGGGMVVAPGSAIDDSQLDVYALTLGKHRDLIHIVRYFRTGGFVRSSGAAHYRTRRVLIHTGEPMSLNVDGEVYGSTPMEFSVAPDALRVLVPRHSTAARYDKH
ncbi:MAG: diacylglycerol kinase, partial [Chloroflexota bacterium]|nr:diacylglycerol kinase [Chloroflexota bacterium]